MAKQKAGGDRALVTNRKAFFNYTILDRCEAGVALIGTEVKSVREGGLNFRDSYVDVRGDELFLSDCHIAPYSHGNQMNHDPGRARKLLLHRREIDKLAGKVVEKGLTLVPLRVYLRNGRVKVEIGLARGKQRHDKRAAIRKREQEQEMRRAVRRR